jgi:uncharacterized protein
MARNPINFEQLLALMPWIPAGPVLDLGAGAGNLAFALAKYGFEVTALDRTLENSSLLQKAYPGILWLNADIRSEDWREQNYSAIFCLNLFPFLPQSDHAFQLERIKDALLPGGVFVFSGFNHQDPSAKGFLAETLSGEPKPTGLIQKKLLEQIFVGWDLWYSFEGMVKDEHPPEGFHEHGLLQVILKKPMPAPKQTIWPNLPRLGAGLGWRSALAELLEQEGNADFIEIQSDDFLDPQWDTFLLSLTKQYTVIPHGVELSVGSVQGIDLHYLDLIARLVARCNSPWWSDHLCYTHTSRYKTWSLNPLPCTEEALEVVVRNSRQAIHVVGRPLLLENPAYYWHPELPGQMSDSEFLSKVALNADCGILLDVANLYGNAQNMGLDPFAFIEALPGERVVQIHLAGGQMYQNLLFDTHDQAIEKPTWELLKHALKHCDIKAISVERDDHYQDLKSLVREVAQARHLMGTRP